MYEKGVHAISLSIAYRMTRIFCFHTLLWDESRARFCSQTWQNGAAFTPLIGLPPVRLLPGYPASLPGRVIPATGSGSDPKPAGFFGPGTRVPG